MATYMYPSKNVWVKHYGGAQPVRDGTPIEYEMRSGRREKTDRPGDLVWDHISCSRYDIIFWRHLKDDDIYTVTKKEEVMNNDSNQPHPHAELMAQYAEDAKETDRPWERWEVKRDARGQWITCAVHPNWNEVFDYRRKPQVVKVCGELPEDEFKRLTFMVDMGYATIFERQLYHMIKKGCECS